MGFIGLQSALQHTPPDGMFYYSLTIVLFLAVCTIVFSIFKWFINRLDKREQQNERYFETIKDAISELKIIATRHETEIQNIKGKLRGRS